MYFVGGSPRGPVGDLEGTSIPMHAYTGLASSVSWGWGGGGERGHGEHGSVDMGVPFSFPPLRIHGRRETSSFWPRSLHTVNPPIDSRFPPRPGPHLSFLSLRIPGLSSHVTLKRTLGIPVKRERDQSRKEARGGGFQGLRSPEPQCARPGFRREGSAPMESGQNHRPDPSQNYFLLPQIITCLWWVSVHRKTPHGPGSRVMRCCVHG